MFSAFHIRDVAGVPNDTDFEKPERHIPSDFVCKVANTADELAAFWRLRKAVFCDEQHLFDYDDRDEYDLTMIPIVCRSLILGMPDRVVGVVRIDQREPDIWWGSRLAVDPEFRQIELVSSSVAQRNRLPAYWASRSIGAGLIFKAVSEAHGLGCRRFLANVQPQHATFFEHLHWNRIAEVDFHGRPHVQMQADLSYYPPPPGQQGSLATGLTDTQRRERSRIDP